MIKRGKGLALLRVTAVSVLALSVFVMFSSRPALAAGNSQLSFEGKIVTNAGVNVPDGNYNMEFKIYTGCTNDTGTGCTTVWTEDWLVGSSPVTMTSGTFQVNLGSICPLGNTTTCQTNTESAIPWDTTPLYLSMQIGDTSTCTTDPPGANFTSDCGGDTVMTPYIELTASPYSEDAGLLNGMSSSAFGQLSDTTAETWNGNTNIFQPATLNVPSVQILQNKSGSFGQDVFDVQGSSGTSNFIQVTSTGANAGAVNINALAGTSTGNAVTITGGTATGANAGGTVSLVGGVASAATTGSSGGPIAIQAGSGTSYLTGGAGGNVTITSGSGAGTAAENAGTIAIDTGVAVNGGTAAINIGTSNALAISLGNSTAATVTKISGSSVNDTFNNNGDSVQTSTNSQTGFQVQNAIGSPIFQVDTTSTDPAGQPVNYLTYPAFEIPNGTLPMGWTEVGTGTILTQNTNQQDVYIGIDSAEVVGTATGAGLTTSSFTAAPPAHTYIVSFYVEPTTTIEPSQFLVTITGTSTQTCSPTGTNTLSTTGFTQLYCQVAATTGSVTSMQITETAAGSSTIYYDAAQMQSTTFNGATISTPSGYQIGGLQLRGIIENPIDVEPETNSTTAFQVQSSTGADVFNVNSLNGVVEIGSNSTTNVTQRLLQLNSYDTFADTASCATTTNQGALYYNTVSNDVRACVNGNWEDMVSTSGLGILLFGVVPDSSNAGQIGDLGGISGNADSPCKVVYGASASSLTVEPCTAYSGGRKVIVPSTTITLTTGTLPANDYANICLSGANNQPALLAANTADTTATQPTFSANNPVLCLATIHGTVAADVSVIYDTRTFTNTQKTFTTTDIASSNGMIMYNSASNEVAPANALPKANIAGVSVAYSGTISTNSINMIIATAGPQWIKALATATTADEYVEGTATAGYAGINATALAGAYETVGINQTVYNAATCNGVANCQGSIFLNPINIGYE
jgi:hypothetical protein